MRGKISALVALVIGVAATIQAEKLYELQDELPGLVVRRATIPWAAALRMDRALVEKTESTDPEENLELLRGFTTSHMSPHRQGSAQIFTSLPDSLRGCDYSSYEVLAKAYVASKNRSNKPHGLKRLDGIVHHYALEHAKKCRPQYAQEFQKFLATIDAGVLHHIEELFKELPEKDLVKTARTVYEADVDMLTTGLDSIDISRENIIRILEAIERLLEDPAAKKLLYAQSDELNGGYMISPEFRSQLWDKYVAVPCFEYTSKSRQLFPAARFDAAIEDEHQQELLHPANEAFRQAWVNHRLCEYMIKKSPRERIEQVVAGRVLLDQSTV